MVKKIWEWLLYYMVEIMIFFNVVGVSWYIYNNEGTVEILLTRFMTLITIWTSIFLLIFVPRRLYRRARRVRRRVNIYMLKKYPEVYLIRFWLWNIQSVIKYFGQDYFGYYVWRFLKLVIIGSEIPMSFPYYKRMPLLRRVVAESLYEGYLGIIYILIIVINKIKEIIIFFDTQPLRKIMKSRVMGYLLSMVTFLVLGRGIIVYLIILVFMLVYIKDAIGIIEGYFHNKRESMKAKMDEDKILWIKNTFILNGLRTFSISGKEKDGNRYTWDVVLKTLEGNIFECKRLKQTGLLCFWRRRLMRKYKWDFVPVSFNLIYTYNKITGKKVNWENKEENLYAHENSWLFEDRRAFRFIDRHAKLRAYSDLEYWPLTNNLELWIRHLSNFPHIQQFALKIVYMYVIRYYYDPEKIYWVFLNERMKKFSLTVSYGDLKWMSEVYFELHSLHSFLKRFYEIIGDEEENKRFCEALKKYYYFPGKTQEEVENIINQFYGDWTKEEERGMFNEYAKGVLGVLKEFGFKRYIYKFKGI